MYSPVVIIGGGPAGLSCAERLARNGVRVLLLERKHLVGPKVCAGGITWSGLIKRVPSELIEREFPAQHIRTRLQSSIIEERKPIIATVNRERLGNYMAGKALSAGATIRTSCQVTSVDAKSVSFLDKSSGDSRVVHYDHLVGADGSASIVRRFLGLSTSKYGIGINYQIPGRADHMEWHLDDRYFGSGYGWVFPHAETLSIGGYANKEDLSASVLNQGVVAWAARLGYSLPSSPRSEKINFDFRGWKFGNIFLAGDAAGFASGLTGEGIYPAILSGEQIAETIMDNNHGTTVMDSLIAKQKSHARAAAIVCRSPILARAAAEVTTLLLRTGLLDFRKLEMANFEDLPG